MPRVKRGVTARARHKKVLTKKAQKRKRQLRGTTNVSGADKKQVRSMLPYV